MKYHPGCMYCTLSVLNVAWQDAGIVNKSDVYTAQLQLDAKLPNYTQSNSAP